MLPKFAPFSTFICHKSQMPQMLNQKQWICKPKLIFIKIYKNRFSFQDIRSESFRKKLLKRWYHPLKFFKKRTIASFCKVLPVFQRFRRYRHKTFASWDLKVLGKKVKAAMPVGFFIKITANIWKKQLTK